MKRFFSRLLALFCAVTIALMGCSSGNGTVTGDYRQDTLNLVSSLRNAIELPEDAPNKAEAQADARQRINDFFSSYRRDSSLLKLTSFTTMRTALNGLAAHYNSAPNRPIPEKLKQRLNEEFDRVELALKRGN